MNRAIIFLWGAVITLMCVLLLLIAYKKEDHVYSRLEHNLKIATKAYIGDKKLTPKISKSVIVYTKDLIEGNYITPDYIEDYCIKDVVYSKGLIGEEYKIEKDCENKE